MNAQMTGHTTQHSSAWIVFTYGTFIAAAVMVAIGVVFMPIDIWLKGYLTMGIVMLLQSCVTVTKTARDRHEGSRLVNRLVNRIEDAKAERLLADIAKD